MNIARMGAVSAQAAQNIIVIRTLPGLANAVGSYVDKSEQPCIFLHILYSPTAGKRSHYIPAAPGTLYAAGEYFV